MKKQISLVSIFLIVITVALGGLSFFIALKLKEEKPATVPTQTKAASRTYIKLLALNQTGPTIIPTESIETPTPTITYENPTPTISSSISPTLTALSNLTPTPTQIQLVTTPLITQESTNGGDLAYISPSPTESGTTSAEISPTQKQVIKALPQSGIYLAPLFIFLTALTLVFFSFIL